MAIANEAQTSATPPVTPGAKSPTPHDSRAYLIWTSLLLLLGGFLAGLGWVAGLFMLWRSKSHTLISKILCTLIWPGGLAAALVSLFIPASTAPGYFVDASTAPAPPVASGWTVAYICAIFVIPVVTQCLALRIALRSGKSGS